MKIYRVANKSFEIFFESKEDAIAFMAKQSASVSLWLQEIQVIRSFEGGVE